MRVLGIVGGIGAGKSVVVNIFKEISDVKVINTDEIGHQIILKTGVAYDLVVAEFGKAILDENKEIVRTKLAEIVFSDTESLQKLNNIMHPLIYNVVVEQIKLATNKFILIEAALLIESGFYKLADTIVGVYADEDTRIERIIRRNNYTYKQAKDRINNQLKWENLRDTVDIIIDNSKDLEFTKQQILTILE